MANEIWNIDVENNELLHKIADYLGQFCMYALLMCPTFQFGTSNNIGHFCFQNNYVLEFFAYYVISISTGGTVHEEND